MTNVGQRGGDEVVQLYIHDELASVARPVTELQGFQRVHLEPGETKPLAGPELGGSPVAQPSPSVRWKFQISTPFSTAAIKRYSSSKGVSTTSTAATALGCGFAHLEASAMRLDLGTAAKCM